MGSKWVWVLIMFVFIQMFLIDQVQGCWKEEKLALFQLKHYFDDPFGRLSDWVFEGDQNSDCCQWETVTCSNTTGRVTKLNLGHTRSSELGEWKLNASLFSAFQLERFSLYGNHITGFVEKGGLDKLSRWNNLEYLNLGYNNFNNDILSSLNVFSSLKELYLNINKLNGTIDLPSLNNLQIFDLSDNKIEKVEFSKGLDNLQTLSLGNNEIEKVEFSKGVLSSLYGLDLSNNKLNGTIDFQGLNNLTILDLGGNKLNNSMLSSIGAPSSLQTLYLYDIGLKGTVNVGELHSLSSLESLYMGHNEIDKFIIPKDNTNLRGLTELHLNNISIHDGSSLLQSLGSFPSLEILSLRHNNFNESKTAQDLPNTIKNLKSLYMDGTNVKSAFFQNIGLMTSLESLSLRKCGLQDTLSIQDGGTLVELLYHQHGLLEVDLSNNNLTGEFPNWLLDNNMKLQRLDLSNNLLEGSFQLSIHSHTNLTTLDISNNFFHGLIPKEIGGYLPSLTTLDLSNNHFDGSIPSSIGDMKSLEELDLSFNRLSDSLTKASSWLGNISRLETVKMSNNHLEGQITLQLCELKYLTVLNLAENNISGSLPSCFSSLHIQQVQLSRNRLRGQLKDVFFNSSSLVTLDLSYNQLHGSIPTWIDGNSNLVYLILSHNNLGGNVPTQICQLDQLRLLDLSHNAFSGNIPPCLDVTSLHDNGKSMSPFVDEEGIIYYAIGIQRVIPEALEFTTKTRSYSYKGTVLSLMSGIDLSCNKLTGSIPQQVGNLTSIRVLNFSHNDLTGPIPPAFLKLTQMESLDLSYNKLSGTIPPQLADLSTLNFFNVANNNLSGKILESTQFSTFNESSYEGNPLLCGLPLHKSCDPTGPPSSMPKASIDNGEDNDYLDMDIFYMSFVGSYIIILLGVVAVLYLNPHWRRAWLYLAETLMFSCYYFILDNLSRRFCH